ncbi:hypothetical protein D3C86_1911860 [compost metagenome]
MLITSAKIMMPGMIEACGAVKSWARAWPSMEPRSAVGGWAPRPRKDRPAVSRIIQPTVVDMVMTMTGSTLGRTSVKRIAA